jgi:hypothetical protein
MTRESEKRELFAGLPRRRWLGGVVSGALALVLCGAFLTDAMPTSSSEDWLYGLEARRDQLARAYQARARAAQPERRARATPGQPARPAALAAIVTPAIDHAAPAPDHGAAPRARHARCEQAAE